MNESDFIERLIRWLERCGIRVDRYAFNLPPDVGGVYRTETREIFINEPNAREALLTLAHEAGHWLGYEMFGPGEGEPEIEAYIRERQAFVYGWRILCLIGAAPGLISRKDWIAAERGNIRTSAQQGHHPRIAGLGGRAEVLPDGSLQLLGEST